MELIERTWNELVEETNLVASWLQRWWHGMDDHDQMMLFGIVCATCVLFGLRKPARRRFVLRSHDESGTLDTVKQFMLAGAVLLIFTFGADIAIDAVS